MPFLVLRRKQILKRIKTKESQKRLTGIKNSRKYEKDFQFIYVLNEKMSGRTIKHLDNALVGLGALALAKVFGNKNNRA